MKEDLRLQQKDEPIATRFHDRGNDALREFERFPLGIRGGGWRLPELRGKKKSVEKEQRGTLSDIRWGKRNRSGRTGELYLWNRSGVALASKNLIARKADETEKKKHASQMEKPGDSIGVRLEKQNKREM